jgi:hypothetical protein
MLLNRTSVRSGTRRRWATLVFCCLLAPAAGRAEAEFRLLDPLQETRIERIEIFVTAEAFKVGTKIGGRTLSAVGLNFTQHFFGVVEKDVPAVALSGWALRYTAGDRPLIKNLGGEQAVAVPFLAYIHAMMQMGDAGAGHTDWRSNFAYVRSPIDLRLWAVHWTVNSAGEWNIGAVYVPHAELDWRSGSRVFTTPREPQNLLVGRSDLRP